MTKLDKMQFHANGLALEISPPSIPETIAIKQERAPLKSLPHTISRIQTNRVSRCSLNVELVLCVRLPLPRCFVYALNVKVFLWATSNRRPPSSPSTLVP